MSESADFVLDTEGRENESKEFEALAHNEPQQVWVDSYENNTTVSLDSKNITRKLKRKIGENDVSLATYEQRLRSQYEKLYTPPSWAQQVAEHNSLEEWSKDGVRILFWKKSSLESVEAGKIDIQRLFDANQKAYAPVVTINFHPYKSLLLTAGYDKNVRIFSIDGKVNPLVSSAFFKNCAIQTCVFSKNSDDVFAAGRFRFMYKWNFKSNKTEKLTRLCGHEDTQPSFEVFKLSISGKYIALLGTSGWVNIMCAKTGRWLANFQSREGVEVADLAWRIIPETQIEIAYCLSNNGSVVEYSLPEHSIRSCWTDIDIVKATKIAVSNDGTVAIGSNTGIVNLFKLEGVDNTDNIKPYKTIDKLTTSISQLVFNSTSELLAIASGSKKDAFRLVHVASGLVYKNWPTSKTKIGRVTCVDFSPGSELLAIGEVRGRVGLYRLKHFGNNEI